jgi:outer membrane protein TolC
MDHRPDLEKQEWAVERSKAGAKAWRGKMYPTVGISATEAATVRSSPDFGRDDFATAVNIGLSYTIFNGGYNKARWSEAKIAHSEARHNRNAASVSVVSQVRSAHQLLDAMQQQLQLQRKNAAFVSEQRDLVVLGYKAGQISLARLNAVQRDLSLVQAQLVLARVGLRQAWHDLKTATGKTLEPYWDDE